MKSLAAFSKFCSLLSIGFGALVLTGWALDIRGLETILPGQVAVKANTGFCFVLTGLALWLLRQEEAQRARNGKRLAKVLAFLVGVVGLLSFLEYWYGWDLGIDGVLFIAGPEHARGSVRPGLMSPITALGFLSLGASLLLLDSKTARGRWLAQLLAVTPGGLCTFGILDFVIDFNTGHTYIAPPTALLLFLLSCGMVCTRTEWGMGRLLASASLGGTLTRRLVPAAVVVPLAVGWLRWKGQQAGLYSDWTGVSLMTVFSIVVLTGLIVVDHSDWERRQGEETINRLASIVISSNDAIIGKTIDQVVTSWNPGAEAIYGYPAQEMVGQPISILVPPDRCGESATIMERIKLGLAVNHFETIRMRKDGQRIHVSLSVSPVRNKAGKIVGACTIARDVSERKRAEEKLRQASLYARSLIEVSLDPLVTIRKDGKVMDVNRATELATGVDRERLIGSDFSEYFTNPEIARQGYEKVFAEESVRDYPLAIRHTSGRVMEVLYNASVFKNEAGEVEGVFAAARDITERKRAERALRSLSSCNESLVQATDEQSLLQQICDLVVEVGGYRMAWVGYAQHDEQKTVRAVAESGFEAGYLGTVNITWADEERGRGPTGTAIRTGTPAVCQDVTSDSRFLPWRENAIRQGYRSCLVLPLKSADEVLGAISIYATEAGAFDATEQHLLEELASNLSYGIVALRSRAERARAETEIRKLNLELEDRMQQRTAQLRKSEQMVRRKLASILSPEGDLGNLDLSDMLDVPAAQSLAESFYESTHIPMFILDLEGTPVVAAGWQDICMKFHRAHPESCKNCRESDRELSVGVSPGEFKLYKCKNQMWDMVTPIMMGGKQIGNLFSGQFFFADEPFDEGGFRSQARRFGFSEKDYLAALAKTPRLNRDVVNASMAFLTKLAQALLQTGYSAVKLARSLEEVRRVNADLAAAIKELEAFTYSVSHDLRAPLRHISGFSKILMEEFGASLPSDAHHHLERIEDATRRMGLLVDDLLNLARVGRRDLSPQVAGLKSIVEEAIAELKADSRGREIEWKVGALPYVECDPGLMKQVFVNLLSNAIKFTRPCPRAVIEIGQKEEDGVAVLYVRDNGVGFSMKYVDKLFGVFQRLHRAEDFEGTGVGLATVQRIIQKHGGRIWAEAELDKGATFYFTLGNTEKDKLQGNAAAVGEQT